MQVRNLFLIRIENEQKYGVAYCARLIDHMYTHEDDGARSTHPAISFMKRRSCLSELPRKPSTENVSHSECQIFESFDVE